MNQDIYQEVMWLFQELGKYLRPLVPGVDGDTRGLLVELIRTHVPGYSEGRNPFCWMKELQSTLNYWHHLPFETEVTHNDVWRDLDTLERVAKYLRLSSEYVENVQDVRRRISSLSLGTAAEGVDEAWPGEDTVRAWIREEVALAMEAPKAESAAALSTGAQSETRKDDRGAIADTVRAFVSETYIEPARAEGLSEVRVRASDVDRALGYHYRRLPLICAALRAEKFSQMALVELSGETGPPSGASTTTTFIFKLL